eukprot:TRINITY_DN11537_c3_g4_i3.p1 TRINITY_DN11537_c3_g4~~TRINITY_DN11537_c3_g4_i3.p1  ORF type:complete len:422 (+),score=84.91 TRINITY_DN11537_c3_g4_i3:83-1348(+)
MEVVLGKSVGPFEIGMSLNNVVELIHDQYQTFTKVEIIYDTEKPHSSNVVIDLPRNGLLLKFTKDSQQLELVELYAANLMQLTHQGKTFASSTVSPDFKRIYDLFKVRNLDYLPNDETYQLQYPGGAFLFKRTPAMADIRPNDCSLIVEECLKQQLLLPLSYMLLHQGRSWQSPDPPARLDPDYYSRVVPIPERGLTFPDAGQTPADSIMLSFGDTTQDAITILGRPDDVYFKAGKRATDTKQSDFIYNYFRRGIDVCFDGTTKVIKKFLLYTNVPGHFEFTRYNRCNFTLVQQRPVVDNDSELRFGHVDVEASLVGTQPTATDDMQVVDLQQETLMDATLTDIDSGDDTTFCITPTTMWSSLPEGYRKMYGAPLTLNRPTTHNTTNPFPLTQLYGCKNLIFEVCSNEAIAVVTLFKPGCR